MEPRASDKPQSLTAKQPSSIGTAIDASFRADASVRLALTENLKPLRAESEAIADRLQKAFEKFNPSNLSAEERERRHYVAPGADPGNALNTVIMTRVNALRSSDDRRGLTLRDSAELRSLIKTAPKEDDAAGGVVDLVKSLIKSAPKGDDSPRRVVDLGELISFINRKSTASSLMADSDYTPFTAEIEAEKMLALVEKACEGATGQGTLVRKVSDLEARELDRLVQPVESAVGSGTGQGTAMLHVSALEARAVDLLVTESVENAIGSGPGQVTARRTVSALDVREVDRLVKDSVNVQMELITAPESQLAYDKIPNSSNDDKIQRGILDKFKVQPGASDVTSYHYFHTLQVAFQHVWTRIFDGQLTSLGRDLYREYVRLKDFSGSTAPDFPVGTLADLRRLIDEVKKLSEFVDEDVPANLRPLGSEPKNNGLPIPTPEDVGKGGAAVLTGGASLFIEWAFNELIKAGNKPVVATWDAFPLKVNEGRGNIVELLPPERNALPPGTVEIVLETDANSYKKKISFQQWDRDTQRPVYSADLQNFGGGHGPIDRLVLNAAQVQGGTVKFISEDEIVNELLLGRYVLGDLTAQLTDRTRVTFRWKGQR
jgi:hypothetical protein